MSIVNNYEWILFDADETLFHFDDFEGLKKLFSKFDVVFDENHYQEYKAINKPLWVKYQNGEITADQLKHKRFDFWATELDVSPLNLNKAFMNAMSEVCVPIDGAIELLDALRESVRLGIVTNGFTDLQQARLQYNGLHEHFDVVVISEQVGVAKPHPKIFDHALTQMGNPKRENILMVGDNPDSDIVGGIDAGLHTCWFNRGNNILANTINPNYTISSHRELKDLLLGGIL